MFLIYVSYGWECAIDCNKFCFLAHDSYFSHCKYKKNIGTMISFVPKMSMN